MPRYFKIELKELQNLSEFYIGFHVKLGMFTYVIMWLSCALFPEAQKGYSVFYLFVLVLQFLELSE